MAINSTVGAKISIGAPVNLRDGLKNDDGSAAMLDNNTSYIVQNVGDQRVFVAVRTDAEGAPNLSTKPKRLLLPGEDRPFTLTAGSTVWAWLTSGQSSIGVTEET